MDHLPTGSTAPDFELQSLDGKNLRLSKALERGPVVLVFYKQSCPSCQLTVPLIQRLFAAVSWVQFWAISQDQLEETSTFVRDHGIEFPVLLDEHPYQVSADYGLCFVPTIYFVDGDRTIQVADFSFSKPTLNSIAALLELEDVSAVFGEGYKSLPEYRPG